MSRIQSAEQIVGTLGARWQVLRAEQPRLRARDAAQGLGVSEAEFVAAQCAGDEGLLLRGGRALARGPIEDVLTPHLIAAAFDVKAAIVEGNDHPAMVTMISGN